MNNTLKEIWVDDVEALKPENDGVATAFIEKAIDGTGTHYTRTDTIPTWQTMDTAPKDGTTILTYSKECENNYALLVMWWSDEKGERCGFGWEAYGVDHMLRPDFWMPLPPAPEES